MMHCRALHSNSPEVSQVKKAGNTGCVAALYTPSCRQRNVLQLAMSRSSSIGDSAWQQLGELTQHLEDICLAAEARARVLLSGRACMQGRHHQLAP